MRLTTERLAGVDALGGVCLHKTTTPPIVKGTKSTSRLVDLAAEVMVNPSNNRRLRVLYTRESPNKSSLLNQPRPLGEMKKMNRMARYNSAEMSAREEARPVRAKLQEPVETRGPSKPATLTISDNTERCPVTERDFTNVSDVSRWKFCGRVPESTNCDRVVGEDEP